MRKTPISTAPISPGREPLRTRPCPRYGTGQARDTAGALDLRRGSDSAPGSCRRQRSLPWDRPRKRCRRIHPTWTRPRNPAHQRSRRL